jgi:hypothetical protein
VSALQHARDHLRDLIVTVDQLAASLLPGTARPWRASTISAARRAELDAEAHLERVERSGIAPGESLAPYSLEISDLLVDILIAADMLAEQVAQAAGVDRLPPASSSYADPRPYLDHSRRHLLSAADGDPGLIGAVLRCCEALSDRAAVLLGHVSDGQTLDAICPWCGGRTEAKPVGGAKTLRVRTLPNTSPPEPVVVCEGGLCEPPSSDCGTWVRGRPAWRQHEWDWLADRLGRTA